MEQYSILVVDDDTQCRDAIRETLDRVGINILTASCGVEAIELFHRHRRSLHATILDMFMPDLTGLETLEAMFRLADRLPAILVTAERSREVLTKAMEAGVYALLNKPVSSRLIVITVNKLLEKYYGEEQAPGPA